MYRGNCTCTQVLLTCSIDQHREAKVWEVLTSSEVDLLNVDNMKRFWR